MRRREFIAALGGAAAAWPALARAQQSVMPVVGFLSSRSPGEAAVHTAAFRRGLSEAGFVEGQNVAIMFRWANGHYERLSALEGDKPSDLPVEAPTKFEMVINLKTAKTLGLDIPLQLQQRADEVIE
jgi:hypothetical protein